MKSRKSKEYLNWKSVKGYNGHYEVSSSGEVRSVDKYVSNNGGVQKRQGNLRKPKTQSLGYLQVDLYRNGRGKKKYIRRLVAESFIPNTSNHPDVNHIDGDKSNNDVSNLEWTSRKENHAHAIKHGLIIRDYLGRFK